jgi:hypothetical protein
MQEKLMASKKILRVYVDTSVVGGTFDKEFDWQTAPFWDAVRTGKIRVIASDLLRGELLDTPEHVRDFFNDLLYQDIEFVKLTQEAEDLAETYISEKVVSKSSLDDARHIAIATITRADILISWNFKHIVNVNRIRGYNSVNI